MYIFRKTRKKMLKIKRLPLRRACWKKIASKPADTAVGAKIPVTLPAGIYRLMPNRVTSCLIADEKSSRFNTCYRYFSAYKFPKKTNFF